MERRKYHVSLKRQRGKGFVARCIESARVSQRGKNRNGGPQEYPRCDKALLGRRPSGSKGNESKGRPVIRIVACRYVLKAAGRLLGRSHQGHSAGFVSTRQSGKRARCCSPRKIVSSFFQLCFQLLLSTPHAPRSCQHLSILPASSVRLASAYR